MGKAKMLDTEKKKPILTPGNMWAYASSSPTAILPEVS